MWFKPNSVLVWHNFYNIVINGRQQITLSQLDKLHFHGNCLNWIYPIRPNLKLIRVLDDITISLWRNIGETILCIIRQSLSAILKGGAADTFVKDWFVIPPAMSMYLEIFTKSRWFIVLDTTLVVLSWWWACLLLNAKWVVFRIYKHLIYRWKKALWWVWNEI